MILVDHRIYRKYRFRHCVNHIRRDAPWLYARIRKQITRG